MCREIYGDEITEQRCVDAAPSNDKLTVGEDNSSSAGASGGSQGALLVVWCIKTVYSDFVFSEEIFYLFDAEIIEFIFVLWETCVYLIMFDVCFLWVIIFQNVLIASCNLFNL